MVETVTVNGPWNKGVPMRAETSRKLSAALKGRDMIPLGKRGGNGRGMSRHEWMLSQFLIPGWVWNLPVKTKAARAAVQDAIPPAYKPDFAWPEKMVCLEVDGHTHKSRAIAAKDAKKTTVLEALGWRVLRVSNAEVEALYTTLRWKGSPNISQVLSSFTTAPD